MAAKDYWSKGTVRRYMARCFNAILIDREDDVLARRLQYIK